MNGEWKRKWLGKWMFAAALVVTGCGVGSQSPDLSVPEPSEVMDTEEAALSVPTLLASWQESPQGMILDSTYVYWVNAAGWDGNPLGSKSAIMRRAKSSLSTALPQALAIEDLRPWGLVLDGSYMYWAVTDYPETGFRFEVRRMLKSGGPVTTIASVPEADGGCFVRDDTAFYLCRYEGLLRLPKTGGTPTVLASIPEMAFLNVVVDATHLYWLNYQGIYRMPKAGGSYEQVYAGRADSLVLSGTLIYFYDASTRELKKISKSGGAATVVVRNFEPSSELSGTAPYHSFRVDGSSVYWLDGANTFEPAKGRVLKASLTTGYTTVMALGQNLPVSLALDTYNLFWLNMGTFDQGWPPVYHHDGTVLKAGR